MPTSGRCSSFPGTVFASYLAWRFLSETTADGASDEADEYFAFDSSTDDDDEDSDDATLYGKRFGKCFERLGVGSA